MSENSEPEASAPEVKTVLIRRVDMDRLAKSTAFVELMRLARGVNSLRFILDAIVNDLHGDSVQARRARFTGGLMYAGALYETCYVLHNADFLAAWRSNPVFQKGLQPIVDHELTRFMRYGVLNRFRNNLIFHHLSKPMRQALRRQHSDPRIAFVDQKPSRGALHMVPEFDIAMSVTPNEVPDPELLESFRAQFPIARAFNAASDGTLASDGQRFFVCLTAMLMLGFAICHESDRLIGLVWNVAGGYLGDESDEGSADAAPADGHG